MKHEKADLKTETRK